MRCSPVSGSRARAADAAWLKRYSSSRPELSRIAPTNYAPRPADIVWLSEPWPPTGNVEVPVLRRLFRTDVGE